MSGSLGFTRWYDRIPELSQAVRLLEVTPTRHREAICKMILEFAQNTAHNPANPDYGLKKLGSQKVLGLMKSKSKRRWYDREPVVHQAFNTLYMMEDKQRYDTAIRILVALEAIKTALKNPEWQRKNVNGKLSHDVVQGVFSQPTQHLLSKIAVVKNEKPVTNIQPMRDSTELERPDAILASSEGMKLGNQNTLGKTNLI